jgi:hypothetical protein
MLSMYFKADIPHVVMQQAHFTSSQRNDLHDIFDRHAPLFRGKVGTYPHKKFRIILKPDALPYYQQCPFPVVIQHGKLLKDELEGEGIIARCYESVWCMPSFILPKKDNKIRLIEDLRKLNTGLLCQQYVLPRIQDIFLRQRDFKFLTKINLIRRHRLSINAQYPWDPTRPYYNEEPLSQCCL